MAEPVRVKIDLNVRVRGNKTFTRLENCWEPVEAGQAVEVYDGESGVYGPAVVDEVDTARGLVYLTVDWAALVDPHQVPTGELTVDELAALLRRGKLTINAARAYHGLPPFPIVTADQPLHADAGIPG